MITYISLMYQYSFQHAATQSQHRQQWFKRNFQQYSKALPVNGCFEINFRVIRASIPQLIIVTMSTGFLWMKYKCKAPQCKMVDVPVKQLLVHSSFVGKLIVKKLTTFLSFSNIRRIKQVNACSNTLQNFLYKIEKQK